MIIVLAGVAFFLKRQSHAGAGRNSRATSDVQMAYPRAAGEPSGLLAAGIEAEAELANNMMERIDIREDGHGVRTDEEEDEAAGEDHFEIKRKPPAVDEGAMDMEL